MLKVWRCTNYINEWKADVPTQGRLVSCWPCLLKQRFWLRDLQGARTPIFSCAPPQSCCLVGLDLCERAGYSAAFPLLLFFIGKIRSTLTSWWCSGDVLPLLYKINDVRSDDMCLLVVFWSHSILLLRMECDLAQLMKNWGTRHVKSRRFGPSRSRLYQFELKS